MADGPITMADIEALAAAFRDAPVPPPEPLIVAPSELPWFLQPLPDDVQVVGTVRHDLGAIDLDSAPFYTFVEGSSYVGINHLDTRGHRREHRREAARAAAERKLDRRLEAELARVKGE